METPKPSRLPIVAFTEWLMVLPATIFIAAAALRSLQPAEYEPARTSGIIVNWVGANVSRMGAAALFLVLPALVLAVGCGVLLRTWVRDKEFRDDVLAAAGTLRRYAGVAFVAAATAVAAVVSLFVVVHMLTD